MKAKLKKSNESVFKNGLHASPMCSKNEHKTCPYKIPSEPYPFEFEMPDGFIIRSCGWLHGYECTCTCHPENQPLALIKKAADCIDHSGEIMFNSRTFLK